MNKRVVTITGTPGFRRLMQDSEGRNRGPVPDFAKRLDPEGVHICQMVIPHNDVEWRAMWLCKMKDSYSPAIIWMDNSFQAFDLWTVKSALPEDAEVN